MKIKSRRQLLILHTLYIHGGAVTSDDLARHANVSIRTVQSEIELLNEKLNREGIAKIVSTPSKGHELEAIDTERFLELREQILNSFGFFRENDIECMRRRILIAQRLLTGSGVKVDELANELYLSKTSIRDDLSWVTDFFASYRIEVKSRAYLGLYCEGDEFEIRQLMVEVFCGQYHELGDIENVEGFEALFYDNKQYYNDLRHAVLKCIRESKMSMGDLESKQICTYLCLMQKRIQNGKEIAESPKMKHLCEGSYEAMLAKKICSLSQVYVTVSETEMYIFSYLLMCLRDYDISLQSETGTISSELIKMAEDVVDYIIDDMGNTLGGMFVHTELFQKNRKIFISALMPLYFRSLYDTNRHKHLVSYYHYKNNDYSPVAIELSREIQRSAEGILHDQIDELAFRQITELNDLLLSLADFKYVKRRIALVDDTGKANARILKKMLMEQFGRFIEYIHIFEQYELRRVDFSDYDCFMINEIENQYSYPMDYVEYDPVSLGFSLNKIFSSVFAKGYSRKVLEEMAPITHIHKNVICDTYQMLLQLVAYKYSTIADEELYRYILEGERLHSYFESASETAFLFLPYSYIEREFVDFWYMEKKINCGDGRGMRAAIIVCLKNDRPLDEIRTLNEIFRWIRGSRAFLERVADDYAGVYAEVFDNYIVKWH